MGDDCENYIHAIHPDQLTRFLAADQENDLTYPEAAAVFNHLGMHVTWDGGEAVPMLLNEIIPFTGEVSLPDLICSFTYPSLTRTRALGNLRVEWSPTNPEEIISLRWKNSENLTNSWRNEACLGDLEYFGNAWVSENEGTQDFWFASLVGWGEAGGWQQNSGAANIASRSITCPGAGGVPIHTEYTLFDGSIKANMMEVRRTFEFGAVPYDHAVRAFIPRLYPLDGYRWIVHPNADGSALITEDASKCGYGCQVSDWNGTWFAIHNPATGQGMMVMHAPSPTSKALWVDEDSGSFTNASSVLLLPPEGGFTGTVVETETLYFYDMPNWLPSLAIPVPMTPVYLDMADIDFMSYLPVAQR